MMSKDVPKILMIGAGRFGRNHLQEWCGIAKSGDVELLGLVVASESSRRGKQEEFGIPVYRELTAELLDQADGIDIATPSSNHAEMVRRCLKHAHVLVEKPLAETGAEARELRQLAADLNRVLMVGHVYRFHPVLRRLKQLVSEQPGQPHAAQAVLVNPLEPGIEQFDANLEILHPFDMLDYLFERIPAVCLGKRRGATNLLSLRYPGPINAAITIGWEGSTRRRTLDLHYQDLRIHCDFIFNTIELHRRDYQVEKLFFPHRHVALQNELRHFVSAIRGETREYPDAMMAARIIDVAVRARPFVPSARPSVAVVGGGIFGATAAAELAQFCDVTLFERHAELMTEASYVNQWRHHSGFHYPRSYDTIQEIQTAKADFEREYGGAVVRTVPAYYAVNARAIEIPRERYLAALTDNGLSFTIESPAPEFLVPEKVSVCVRSDEGVYDFAALKAIVGERVRKTANLQACLAAEVVYGAIDPDGRKRLTVKDASGIRNETFDYVVNATYQNRNLMAQWFNFPVEPLRFDLVELIWFEVDAPQLCVTVIDAPFVSVIGTGRPNQFILSHRFDMVLRSRITVDGMPPRWEDQPTNRESMFRHATEYMPFLRNARMLESRYVVRTVNAYARDVDARPTVITEHGFGCWSVLGGKIITCVTNAREIAQRIRAERVQPPPPARSAAPVSASGPNA